ncbi:MAG: glycerophosphodiester phosphodiesterase family protein [Gammaproteobacteria bacterium]|jgi:glycerophosphoryl diester phosphodiesterase
MSLRFAASSLAQRAVDLYYASLPRRRPSRQALERCRVVSHRGEHDNRLCRENTLAAFSAAADAGAWGIEFDVRWTRDLQPVVIHDPGSARVFGPDIEIAAVEFAELRRCLPEIPSLEEVVEAHGRRRHLMVELKPDRLGRAAEKGERLARIFAALEPGRDFHFLALQPESLEPAAFAGRPACLLVAEVNTARLSRLAVEGGYGGLCGHYLLIGNRVIERHRACGQQLGTGFAASRFGFYREVNRGIDWIFTNHAAKLARLRARLLRR